MNTANSGQTNRAFLGSMFNLLDRVEYRRMTSAEDIAAIEKLRRESYNNREFIDAENFGSFIDEHDRSEDCYVIGVYIEESLISTVRLHVVSARHLHGPTASYFPARAAQLVEGGKCYIDPSRFAADHHMLWQYPAIPFLTLRVAAMASEYFDAANCMTFVRADAASFYRRSFGAVDMEPPQSVRGFAVPMMLLGARIDDIRSRLETRLPFFKSQLWEQKMMFAPSDELNYPPVNILPSARYANPQLFGAVGMRAQAV
jgi:hypothetical protein